MTSRADQPAPPTGRTGKRWLFAAACLGTFTFGVVIALLGTLFGLPEMRARLSTDLAGQGDLFGLLALAMLASSLLVGPTLDRYGSKPVLVVASALAAAGLALLAAATSFASAALAALLLGCGGGWLNVAPNALVSETHGADRGRMLNLLGVFFGLGALFVPLVVALSFGRLSIAGIILLCGAVAAATGALPLFLAFPPARETASFPIGEMLASARRPGVLLLAALLFFESGNEASMSGWTTTYIGSVGWSPRTATVVLLGYWVVAIGGRLVSSRVQAWIGKERLVLASGILSAGGCIVLLLAGRSLPALVAGAWLTAFALAAIFPTTLAIAGDRYQRFAGTVFGFLFSVGSVGSTTFPWAIGHVSQGAGVRLGMLVPLAGTLLVSACAAALVHGRISRRNSDMQHSRT